MKIPNSFRGGASSERMAAVQSPIIPIVASWIRATPGTLSLGQGVVAYPPPPQARDGIERFFSDPMNHRYKPVFGLPELVEALWSKLQLENAVSRSGRQLLVSAGSNLAFVNTLLAITEPGDEVVLFTPYYFNHEMAIQMLGCRPVLVPTNAAGQPDLEMLEASLTPRTRAVVTVSPNNPSGAVYSETTLRRINALCADRGIFHLSDEAYEYFIHGPEPHFSPASIPGSEPHTVVFQSFSKGCGFASWRVGYHVVPESLFDALLKVQDTQLICTPVISQFAALSCTPVARDYCRSHLPAIRRNRDRMLQELSLLGDRCQVTSTDGAFYLLLRLQTARSSLELARRLVEEHQVAVIPGEAFGVPAPCLLRVAYGSMDDTTAGEGAKRLVRGLQALL